MYFLIGVLVLIGFIFFCYCYIKRKVKNFLGSDLATIIKEAQLEDEMLPKSLSSMDSIYMENLLKDFPEININEIKRIAEKNILSLLSAIEKCDVTGLNGKIKEFAVAKIQDSKVNNYSNIRFHNSVLSNYSKTSSIATIIIGSSFEYILNGKKIQDRVKVEFIYIIDEEKVLPDQKLLGLNCPNCGSPIKTLGLKYCSYCGTGVKDFVKKSWVCNDITFY